MPPPGTFSVGGNSDAKDTEFHTFNVVVEDSDFMNHTGVATNSQTTPTQQCPISADGAITATNVIISGNRLTSYGGARDHLSVAIVAEVPELFMNSEGNDIRPRRDCDILLPVEHISHRRRVPEMIRLKTP